jgi:hypothetical protein
MFDGKRDQGNRGMDMSDGQRRGGQGNQNQ